ncbi:MAG TPA: NADH-quinone oxidoreductase subunit N, partial [Candidatus Kapabacteria bacterium]|nr:NADH-quinone oxidoreductase subunit N [Candidatus Kapabacteria bacterium]
ATGLVVLMVDAFEKTPSRTPLFLSVIGAAAAAISAFLSVDSTGRVFGGMILNNGYSHFYSIVFSLAAILAVLLAERYLKEEEVLIGEFSALTLFAACGMVMMASGADLIVTFLGLETMSIAFYVMSGLFRRRVESNEAALKYFLLGSFSTGFFLYGIALLYGAFGTTNIDAMNAALLARPEAAEGIANSPMVWLGIAMMVVGFCFKVAAFPFHQWAPDVYEGAPTVVSGFMSTAGKAAAFSAMALLFNFALGPLATIPGASEKITVLLGVLAVASMFYGNITALSQTHVKRMLAYSSIAHAGYLLLGIASMTHEGANAVAVYLTAYTLMQIGAFGVVGLLEKQYGGGLTLSDYQGLAKRHPWLAFIMTIMMLSLAGIPPFVGFFGKYYLFTSAVRAGLTFYTVLGVIASLISVYFYLRLIVLMYFREAEEGASYGVSVSGSTGAVRVAGTGATWTALIIASALLLVLGVLPMILTGFSQRFFANP